jgi:hypothetical protein
MHKGMAIVKKTSGIIWLTAKYTVTISSPRSMIMDGVVMDLLPFFKAASTVTVSNMIG